MLHVSVSCIMVVLSSDEDKESGVRKRKESEHASLL
jgi:hypothetical protein